MPGEYGRGMWVHCLSNCSVKIAPALWSGRRKTPASVMKGGEDHDKT